MGGVILRQIQELPDRGGIMWCGCCLLAPPNKGSRLASTLCQNEYAKYIFGTLFGESALELGDLLQAGSWPEPPQPCGIIAGNKSLALSNPTSWLTFALRTFEGMTGLFAPP